MSNIYLKNHPLRCQRNEMATQESLYIVDGKMNETWIVISLMLIKFCTGGSLTARKKKYFQCFVKHTSTAFIVKSFSTFWSFTSCTWTWTNSKARFRVKVQRNPVNCKFGNSESSELMKTHFLFISFLIKFNYATQCTINVDSTEEKILLWVKKLVE